ncbi:MAG TPA: TetR/AcrR family transcriptional regulator [Candidatus Acidoferrales bacterium]|nr:TetR/AcrR family transcriptional regulator [Candidatus Acidoferrales bacterium]
MGVAERKSRQKADLRQEILDAARDLFVREGYDNVSIRKIADKVEYAPGTIYLYFKDKAEILDTLCQQTFEKLHQRMEAIRKDPGDPVEALRRGLRTYVQFGVDNPNHYIVTFVLAKRDVEMHEPSAKQAGLACFDCLRGIVGQCLEGGYINGGGVEETSQALWSAIHGVTSLLVMDCGFPFVERTRLIERLIDILIKGIRAHKS